MLIKRDARYALLCAQTADIRYRYNNVCLIRRVSTSF